MPVLHLKNKVTRSMITTVEQSLAVGAIPSHFTLDPKEAFQLLKEVQELKDVAVHFKWRQDNEKIDAAEPNIGFLLKQTNDETRKTIVNRWYQGLYTVSYVHVTTKKQQPEAQALRKNENTDLLIPLKVVKPKPKDTPKEEKNSSSK